MKKRNALVSLIFALLLCPGIQPSPNVPAQAIPPDVPSSPAILSLNSGPVYFIENQGQLPGPAGYFARCAFGTIRFAPDEIVFQFIGDQRSDRKKETAAAIKKIDGRRTARVQNIRLSYVGADKNVRIEPQEQNPAKFNFFGGNDPAKWISGVPAFKKIIYRSLYPGIDLLILGEEGSLKHEYRVKPGARVEDIRIRYSGAEDIRIGKAGRLEIDAGAGSIIEGAPVSYQIINGEKRAVQTAYDMDASGMIGFVAGPFDRNADLVIDPVLMFSSYLGGSTGDAGNAIAVDLEGNVYVAGSTYSSNFPTTTGAFDTGFGGARDAFVSKFDPTGSDLIYSTFLGGSSDEGALGIAVDFGGNAYVCGFTDSSNFPTTVGAYDRTLAGQDAWLIKLNVGGSSLFYSTLLGGSAAESGLDLAVDQAGNAYLTGFTASGDFPTTPGAYDPVSGMQESFLTKFNASGTGLAFSTFFGGSDDEWGYGIALGSANELFLTGVTMSSDFPTTSGAYDRSLGGSQDVFVAKFSSSGNTLNYSTYLGGSSTDGTSGGLYIDLGGNAYLTGDTASSTFPTTPGAFDSTFSGSNEAFVCKLNAAGSALSYSTFLGGSSYEYGKDIAADILGNAVLVGYTRSTNWPTTPDAFDAVNSGLEDLFVVQLNPAGTDILYSTYLGGSGEDRAGRGLALDVYGNAYISGETESGNFPTTAGAYDRTFGGTSDAVVIKLYVPMALRVFDGHDFNGNITSDPAVFRPVDGRWYIKNAGSYQWGKFGDIPVNGNFDGDTMTEPAVWRPADGYWYVNGMIPSNWGVMGDIPVPHDYNGNWITDIAVWRPSNGYWYVKGFTTVQWGQAGDYPVPGDYDADGVDEMAVWRPKDGTWYIKDIGNYQWGQAGDIPVPGDYNADGKTDLVVFRPAEGTWYFKFFGGGTGATRWGAPGDVPVPGDYNGDGMTEPAVWRPGEGNWYVYGGSTLQWGQAGDIPAIK